MERPLPRYVTPKPKKGGLTSYYWNVPTYFKKLGCTIHLDHNTRLGTDYELACGRDGKGGKAALLNGLFDEWDARRLGAEPVPAAEQLAPYGTVDWLFRTYRNSDDWKERVSKRTAPDYERTIRLVCEWITKTGDRIGSKKIQGITAGAADKLYHLIRDNPKRKGQKQRLRVGEKVVAIAERAWNVVYRLHPDLFAEKVPNPWAGVATTRRKKKAKLAVTREDVYTFAWGALERGHAHAAAAAVICYEWLQRPENVLAGYVRWQDYRNPSAPTQIRIEHHKTGEMVLHPLEEGQGNHKTLFYEEAEEILSQVPRLGLAIVMRRKPGETNAKAWDIMTMGRIVRNLRKPLGLPDHFTLDACRHGGMTELEEAELTDGQGRALSAHKSTAYEGYAKRTERRALAATRKRHAHLLALAEEAAAPVENLDAEFSEMDELSSAISEAKSS